MPGVGWGDKTRLPDGSKQTNINKSQTTWGKGGADKEMAPWAILLPTESLGWWEAGGWGWIPRASRSGQARSANRALLGQATDSTLGRRKQLKSLQELYKVKPHLSYLGKAAGSEPIVFPLFLSQEISRREVCLQIGFKKKKRRRRRRREENSFINFLQSSQPLKQTKAWDTGLLVPSGHIRGRSPQWQWHLMTPFQRSLLFTCLFKED